jgi:prophage antirepressor-like protein
MDATLEVVLPDRTTTLPVVATEQFGSTKLEVIDKDGERWVTAKQLAEALGYSRADKLAQLIERNPDEFRRKTSSLKMRDEVQTRNATIINYHGVIRASMLSNAPRAKEFRDWAEDVLFNVMVWGYHVEPGATPLTLDEKTIATITQIVVQVVQQQLHPAAPPERQIDYRRLPHEVVPGSSVSADYNTMTPTECIERHSPNLVPLRYLNRGGRFDKAFAKWYERQTGHYPPPTAPGLFKKNQQDLRYPNTDHMRQVIRHYYRRVYLPSTNQQRFRFKEV